MSHWKNKMYEEWKSFKDYSFPYLTGNSFASQCRFVLNYDGFKENTNSQNYNWFFVKTDYIRLFYEKYLPKNDFILFTHNSDYPINSQYEYLLNKDNLKKWFAQNLDFNHKKLFPIPIGIANYGYSHGDVNIINKIRSENNLKNKMFYANYKIDNNHNERNYCLQQTNIKIEEINENSWNGFAGGYLVPSTYEEYLRNMSKSYFCISPKGNGIDCHRTWESLYVKTIPIVTKSLVTEYHKDYPMIILNDWSEFKNINFTKELYDTIWNNFNTGQLHIDNYLKRIINIIQQ